MIRNTLLSVAALAAFASTASAGGYGYGHGYDYGYKKHVAYKVVCHIKKIKIVVGHDYYGEPIFKWVNKKFCEKVWY